MSSFPNESIDVARENFIEGRYQIAEPILERLLQKGSKNPEVLQMLATIYYDRGQFNKAIQTFKKALELDPAYTDASVGLSIILNDLGKYEEGKKVFIDAQERLDKKTSVRTDLHANERLAGKHEELADLYSQYNRYTEALEQLQRAYKLTKRKSELIVRMADTLVQLGLIHQAVRDLRKLLHEQPLFIPARLKLGMILYNSNNIAEAVEQWETILTKDPHNSEASRHIRMAKAAGITTLGI